VNQSEATLEKLLRYLVTTFVLTS